MTSMAAVLVVEDEVLIRMGLVDALSDAGHATIEAGNVLEAVAALALHENIATIITDVDMPGGLTGIDLAELVARTKPNCQLIVVSGRDIDPETLPPGSRFMPKPYDTDALVREVKRPARHPGHRFFAANASLPGIHWAQS